MRRPVFIFLLFCLCGITSLKARDIVPFNDKWFFKKDSLSTEVTIPHTWNATDMQIKAKAFYEGSASYRKSCLFPESWKGKRLFLRFEGVGSCVKYTSTVNSPEAIREDTPLLHAKSKTKSNSVRKTKSKCWWTTRHALMLSLSITICSAYTVVSIARYGSSSLIAVTLQ